MSYVNLKTFAALVLVLLLAANGSRTWSTPKATILTP